MDAPITAVIPTYNAAAFLADAVASVRAQTARPAEILVVDDCSVDDTRDVAAALELPVIRQDRNRGPSAARNAGLRAARHDLVAFLDADDAWLPWHLEACVGALVTRPNAAVAVSRMVPFEESPPALPPRLEVRVPVDALVTLLEESFVVQSAVVIRAGRALALGGYDERRRHAEDYDLWVRLAESYDFAVVEAPGVRYRSHPGQATRDLLRMVQNSFDVRLRALDRLATEGPQERRELAASGVRRALDTALRSAWHIADAATFDFLLDVGQRVPGAGAIVSRWAKRRRVAWSAYHALRAVKQRLR